MQEFETTITSKGQVTIPQEIRRLMDVHPKDKVRFEVDGEIVRLTRASSKLLAGYGAVSPHNRPENFQAIREQVEEGIAREAISEE